MGFETTHFGLKDRWALVTGASGGIGKGIAADLARAKANVIVHYRSDSQRAETAVSAATSIGAKTRLYQADLTETGAIAAMFDALEDAGEFPTMVVNNAALQPISAYAELPQKEWHDVLSANLTACHLIIQEISKRWIRRKITGSIVNIASIEGMDPAVGHSHYASSKAGLLMLTRAAALELGEHDIRVNAVSPGLIHREGLENQWPEGVTRWKEKAPLTRLGKPSDIANAVLFLLSDAAEWITGSNLVVDGGMSAQSRW